MLTEEWNEENTKNRTNKIIGTVQLRKYGKFLENYSKKLQAFEKTYDDDNYIFLKDPVSLNFCATENIEIFQLVNTDNKILNKVISVLAALCLEATERKQEGFQKYYPALLLFGEQPESEDSWSPQLATSNFLPMLQELSCFIARCQQLLSEFLQQMSVIYTLSPNNQIIQSSMIHFEDIMDHIGEVLMIFVTLDELILNLDKIHETWSVYKKLIHTVQLQVEKEKLMSFDGVVRELESTVLSGRIFLNTLEKLAEFRNKNSNLPEEFNLYLKNMLSVLETKSPDSFQALLNYNLIWVKVNCVFVLNCHLFGLHDKKLLKQIWEISKRFTCTNLVGNIIWLPDKFLDLHLAHAIKQEDKKQIQTIGNTRLEMLNQKTISLPNDVVKYTCSIAVWTIRLRALMNQETNDLKLEDLKRRCSILLQGVQLATEISTRLKTIMNLHAALEKPMTKQTVLSLCKLIELLKSIEFTYQQYNFVIAESLNHVLQYLAYQSLVLVNNAKKRIIQDKTYTKKHLDTLSALVLAERILFGPVTYERYLITRLALSVARGNPNKVLKDEEVESIYSNLNHLNGIQKLQTTIKTTCDTSFLYLHRVLLPVYFKNISENKINCQSMCYMLSSLSDSLGLLQTNDNSLTQNLVESFKNEVHSNLLKYTLEPLCHEIETDLRLQVHSHLQKNKGLFNPEETSQDFNRLIQLCPVKLFDSYVNVKSFLENYLDTTFYNLATVALHDCKTYGVMQNLAAAKYNTTSVQNHLPYHTLEQGVDVLEIMRNIHIFVAKYLYNLNNQIFIEESSNNKHLNTINIRHISNSIRMHGIGIMNTTVNFTYQFLRKKFYIFSQFLFDEQIKSRLTKDILYFKEHRTQTDQRYSYDKADKFNKGIRKLGLSADGLSYLDQFRVLISQIGNAMGYVRMIRSGGMHCCSTSLGYISDLEDIVSFEQLSRENDLSDTTCKSAERLDHVINNLANNFAEGTQYFKLLVDVFANDFRDAKNNHLQNFYVIVPALTINFVEYIIAAKDKINRRNKTGATFTDDGFAMGVAYILKLLDQNKKFDSLHWFESVREKCARDQSSLVRPAVAEENLRTTMMLTAKRLSTFQQEFELLYYNLSSAKIFFEKQSRDI